MLAKELAATVIIVTLDRPDCIQRCLECLFVQESRPKQIIVVDASQNDLTEKIARQFPDVLYLRNENGYGRMTASRNIGLGHATGDIIVFVDDDAFAHPEWLENLLATYTDPTIGAVGGRALNNQPGEEHLGVNEIGQLKPNGVLTGNFAANPGKTILVDHIIGCNMSFRREVLAQLGGFREDYLGISGVREDTDICLRVKRIGYKIFFNPLAVVDHIGAPQVKGKRFDVRYAYYSQHNHVVLLIRNYGLGHPIYYKNIIHSLRHLIKDFLRRSAAAFAYLGAGVAGTVIGTLTGLKYVFQKGTSEIIRNDQEGKTLTVWLMQTNHTDAQNLTEPLEQQRVIN